MRIHSIIEILIHNYGGNSMNNYKKFTKITEHVIELAKLIEGEGIFDINRFSTGMMQFIPEEYNRVKVSLFPAPPLYYNNPINWQTPWTPDSPVRRPWDHPYGGTIQQHPTYRPQHDIFDQMDTHQQQMNVGMSNETNDIIDATNFINSIKDTLPKGHLNQNFPSLGEIVNAVREHDFQKAVQLIRENWVEGEESNPFPNTTTDFRCDCGALAGEDIKGQLCPLCETSVRDQSENNEVTEEESYTDPLDDITD